MALIHPDELDGRRLGREGLAQRLLTGLVLGTDPPGWNKPQLPSTRGAVFVQEFERLCFGSSTAEVPEFVDEFELPARQPDEPSGWPDYALLWPGRLVMIELKTERKSHRPEQLPYYRDLGRRHHPGRERDLVYVTPSMPLPSPPEAGPSERFRHVTWESVGAIAKAVWSSTDDAVELATLKRLLSTIDDAEHGRPPTWIGAPRVPVVVPRSRQRRKLTTTQEPLGSELADGVASGIELAALVQADGQQRAIEIDVDEPDALDVLRLALREELRSGPTVGGITVTHVAPWLWRPASTGRPMTECGRVHGYEVRLSRYAKRPWDL